MKIVSFRFLLPTLVTIAAIASCGKSNTNFYGQGGLLPSNYIYILDSSFSPNTLNIAIGSSVTFVNNSSLTHTIKSDDTTFLKTPGIVPGTSFYFKKDTIGTINYHCVEHPNVRGTIIYRP